MDPNNDPDYHIHIIFGLEDELARANCERDSAIAFASRISAWNRRCRIFFYVQLAVFIVSLIIVAIAAIIGLFR